VSRLACLLAALPIALGAAGCGSSNSASHTSSGSGGAAANGIAAQSPQQILAATMAASNAAKSVHLAGSTVTGGQRIQLDLNLGAGQGSGSFSQAGLTVQLITLQNVIYLKAGGAFWQKFAGSAAAQLLADKWLKAPASSSSLAGIAQLTDFHKLLSTTLSQHGTLAKQGTSTVNGQSAVAVKDTSRGGTLYIATTGPAYPLQLVGGSGGGKLTFDHWNEPVTATAPSGAVDLSKLQGG
jgi:hypothetical protein